MKEWIKKQIRWVVWFAMLWISTWSVSCDKNDEPIINDGKIDFVVRLQFENCKEENGVIYVCKNSRFNNPYLIKPSNYYVKLNYMFLDGSQNSKWTEGNHVRSYAMVCYSNDNKNVTGLSLKVPVYYSSTETYYDCFVKDYTIKKESRYL